MYSYQMTQWVLFFFFYSFVGWVWESCYVSIRQHRWVNRGFMHGPMLPLYGSGALTVLIATMGVRESIPLVFLLGMVVATLLEYLTGVVMERLFRVRYWDYSRQKFQVKGYICLSSSLCWGAFSVLLVKVVHVPVENLVLHLPPAVADAAVLLLVVAGAADLTQSFNEAMDLKRILMQLEESREQIRRLEEKLKSLSSEFVEEYKKRYEMVAMECKRRTQGWKQGGRFRKAAFLQYIDARREERRGQLVWLEEKADQLFREELPSRISGMIGEEKAGDLAQIKRNILRELQRLGARTDRMYLRIVRHLRRNPAAVSEKFKEALEEIRRFMDMR